LLGLRRTWARGKEVREEYKARRGELGLVVGPRCGLGHGLLHQASTNGGQIAMEGR